MRIANTLSGLAVLIWLGLLLMGRGLVERVATQQAPGYPNAAQIETYVVLPALVTIAVSVTAWLCNGLNRWPWLLTLVACVSLALLAPFLLRYSGGV